MSKRIMIIRNDKLGDFILALPAFALIKRNFPNTEIHTLVPTYTAEIAKSCKWIDKVLIDPGKDAKILSNLKLLNEIKCQKYDAVITLFSTTRIGLLMKLAGIAYRLAPATKLAQIFYNHKLIQRRSRSEKPEYCYNMDLIYHFLKQHGIKALKEPSIPYLKFPEDEVKFLRQEFIQEYNIPFNHKLIFIHAGSGGSANNLSPYQFATLANQLKSGNNHTIIISIGPGELETGKSVAHHLTEIPHVIYESVNGLVNFSKHIQFADIFIAGSTGPLHIAGALDTPTVGFYTHRRSATSLRWQTLNSANNRLAFCPIKNAEQEDMSSIDLISAAKTISEKFLLND